MGEDWYILCANENTRDLDILYILEWFRIDNKEVKYKEGHQKWKEYLQTMENYLRNARLDYYDYIKSNNKEEWYDNIYEDIYEDINALDSSKLTKELEKEKGKQQEIDKYYEERNKGLKEGLRMFGEQMGSLWY